MKFSLSAFLLPRLGHHVLVDEALGLEGRLDEVVGIVPPESALERAWRKKSSVRIKKVVPSRT